MDNTVDDQLKWTLCLHPTLVNQTLRTLTALQSSLLNSTTLIWIPIFAVLFLGERITLQEIIGLVLAGFGTLMVQMRQLPKGKQAAT